MPSTKRRAKYTPPHGAPVAVAPKAWGVDFDLFAGGDVDAPKFDEIGDYAVVTICGPMTKSSSWWGESYEDIRERAEAAFASGCAKVCLKIDSPGGDLAGCFELAHDLRAMAESTGKILDAFTDGDCCSGAMALASAATGEIVATPQAFLGSVGVWAALVDMTAANAMYGVKVVVASSGEHKADWNPNVPMTEEAFNRLQAQVVAQADLFFALVSSNRPGVSVETLRDLKGAAPFGEAALSVGLCDRLVPSWSAFLSGDDAMSVKSKGSKYDEAMGALRAAAEEDSEDGKKAKKALKAIESGDESDEDKEKREKEETARKAEESAEKERAQATITDLARQVQTLTANNAERDRREKAEAETARRTVLFAKRPDFGPEVRAALEKLPIEELEKAVQTFPRVIVSPEAAANAMTPNVTKGERNPSSRTGAYQPSLTAKEQEMLDKSDPAKKTQVSNRAEVKGATLQMPKKILSREEAQARLDELEKEAV